MRFGTILPQFGERTGVTCVTVPTLFWTKSVDHALELLEEFATRTGLPRADG